MPASLSAHSSAHASLPQFGPVRSSTTPGRSHTVTPQIHLQHKIRRAEPHCWKGAVFPFHATRDQKTISQWVNGFMINLESQAKVLCCARCMEKRDNAAFKKKNRDQREWPPQHTEKRGSDCSVEWSQSISSPSWAHGVANEPGDRPATTHRDKRVWTNHQLDERLNRQTSEVQMSQWRDKKSKQQTKKKNETLCERIKKWGREQKHGGPPKAPESWEMD